MANPTPEKQTNIFSDTMVPREVTSFTLMRGVTDFSNLQQYDLFDMEAYAAALFCRTHGIPFYCFKAVSDNLDGSLKDWRSILGEIRRHFTALLGNIRIDTHRDNRIM